MTAYRLTGSQRQIAALVSSLGTEDLVIDALSVFPTTSPISRDRIAGALAAIVAANDVFRIELSGDAPEAIRQQFLDSPCNNVEVIALPDRRALDDWRAEPVRPLGLTGSPWSLEGLLIGSTHFGIRVRMHHILADAYSVAIVINDFHRHMVADTSVPTAVRGSFEQAIIDGLAYLDGERFSGDIEHWAAELAMPDAIVPWLGEPNAPARHAVERTAFPLDEALSARWLDFSRNRRIPLSTVLMACCAQVLGGERPGARMMIGATTHGRASHAERETVGMFVNTVPVPVGIPGDVSLLESVQDADSRRRRATRRSRANYTLLRSAIGPSGGATSDLCDLIINELVGLHSPDPAVEVHWRNSGSQQNPLTISIADWGATGRLQLDYDRRVSALSSEDIARLHQRLVSALGAALSDPTAPMAIHPVLTTDDRAALVRLNESRDTEFPRSATVLTLWDEQHRAAGSRPAVLADDMSLSFAEVELRANRMARTLQGRGVRPGDRVALLGTRGPDLITAMLGIVKAGASYVPIEPDQPVDRIQFILEDCAPAIVLTLAGRMSVLEGRPVLDPTTDSLAPDGSALPDPTTPESELYVIYTSGTTGRPKGVRVCHRNVVRLLCNDAFPFKVSVDDVWLLFHSYAFDFSVWEMYGALLTGGRLVIPSNEQTRDPEALAALIRRTGVTILNQVPSSFYVLSRSLHTRAAAGLRYVVFGGETLDEARIAPWAVDNPHVQLVNMYGITETTVHVTFKNIDPARPSPDVGRPLPTTGVVILKGAALAGIGEQGEICVYGDGVALGYLNRPELTAERFVHLPAVGETVYRSGDLGLLTAEGTLTHLGRLDSQVKINGFRIELGEVDAALRAIPGVVDGAVLGPDEGIRGLQAYFVADDDDLSPETVDAGLRERLPGHMVPSHCVWIREVPLTSNGKLDAARLRQQLVEARSVQASDGARDTVERLVAGVYAEVLGVSDPGIHEQFHALGGDSVQAMMIAAQLRERGQQVRPQDLSAHSTIAEVAAACRRIVVDAPRRTVAPFGSVATTPMIHQFRNLRTDDPAQHNQSLVLTLADQADTTGLPAAWAAVVAGHPVLRSVWDGATLTVPDEFRAEDFALRQRNLRDLWELSTLAAELNGSFDLGRQPLIRAVLAQSPGAAPRLLLVAHHLVVDAVSWRVLLRDLVGAWSDPAGSQVARRQASSFRAWAAALVEHAETAAFGAERRYWQEVHGTLAALPSGGSSSTHACAELAEIHLSTAVVDDAVDGCRARYGLELPQTLATAAAIALAKVSALPCLVMEVEHHGRVEVSSDLPLGDTVGWFTATYPVLLHSYADIDTFIVECKDRLAAAARYPLGDGLLRLLDQSIPAYAADLTFNYLGDSRDVLAQQTVFAGIEFGTTSDRSPGERLRAHCVVDAYRSQAGVHLRLSIDTATHGSGLAPRLRAALVDVLEWMSRGRGAVLTATDVGADDLSTEEWMLLLGSYSDEVAS